MDIEIYQQANNGNIQEIRALRTMGAGFEWKDNEGETALSLACSRHERYDLSKTLIELGANINAYSPRRNGGTPLHHATMKGCEKTVKLLLANGANPFIRNSDGNTALDLARNKRHVTIVRAIESHICIFSGRLRAEYAVLNCDLSPIPSDFRPGEVWVAVLPCESNDSTRPQKFELAIYLAEEVAVPREVLQLHECNIQPDFLLTDPSLIIETSSGTRYKLFPYIRWRMTQLRLFYDACRGINAENNTSAYTSHSTTVPTRPCLTRLNAFNSVPLLFESNLSDEELDHEMSIRNEVFYDALTCNCKPSIVSSSHLDTSVGKNGEKEKGICVICLDQRAEAACIPCGHMAGCMKCLKKIEAKNRKCPVCRTNVDQIVKIYTV